MSDFPLIIDVFEGSGLLDPQALKDNNISHVLVRMGCYSRLGGIGGNRLDDLFLPQYELLAADPFFRVGVYLPYNPWKNWEYNRDWTLTNMPAGCKTLEADVENRRKTGYSPQAYAADYSMYIHNLPDLHTITYTGASSIDLLSAWPLDVRYSWAQYYYSLYPSSSETWTWDRLRATLSAYNGPSNGKQCPTGDPDAWQITGDKIVLPGSKKGLDVYAWLKSRNDLDKLFSKTITPPPPPVTGTFNQSKFVVTVGMDGRPTISDVEIT